MRPSRNVATAAVAAAAFGAVGTAGPASAAARPPGPGHAFLLKDQNGHSAYVNLTHVFSPGTLRDSSGAKDNPPRGKRWVVTAFKVTDWHGKIAEDADGDVSVIGTNHQVYETYITGDSSYNGYTDFNYGEITLNRHGAYLIGAVSILMPKNEGIRSVTWAMSDGFGGQRGTWRP